MRSRIGAPHLEASVQQFRRGALHRRAHGEKRVGDPLQLLHGLAAQALRAGAHDPTQLHLRQPGHFRKAAEGKRQAVFDTGERRHAVGIGAEGVVGKDLVGDQGQTPPGGQPRQRRQFRALDVRSRGIVGIHQHHGARAVGDGRFERTQVDRPATAIPQRILARIERFHVGEVFEQRIGGARHQHLVARIGQQLEQVGVRLAGAGGEQNAAGIHRAAARRVIAGHRLAGGHGAGRRRLVDQHARIGEGRGDFRRIAQPRARGIGFGEIQDARALAPPRLQQLRQTVGTRVPMKPR